MPRACTVSLFDKCLRHEFVFGFQSCKELEQSSAVELPFERARLAVAQLFVQSQPLLNFLQAGEDVRGQYLPLDDRNERVDSGLILASTQDSTAANVLRSQVLQGAAPLMLMFHSHGPSRTRRQSRMSSQWADSAWELTPWAALRWLASRRRRGCMGYRSRWPGNGAARGRRRAQR
jgi:hypothetical protein